MDMSKYRGMFLSEAKEHLAGMSRLILALEKNPADAPGIDALFREQCLAEGLGLEGAGAVPRAQVKLGGGGHRRRPENRTQNQ